MTDTNDSSANHTGVVRDTTHRRKGQRPPWLGEDKRTFDHCRVHIQVLRDPALGAYELAAYLGLVAHADTGTADAHPSLATLAEYAGASERRMRDAVRTLQAAGYLTVRPRPGGSNVYVLLPPPELGTPAPPAGLTPAPPAALERATPAPPAGHPGTTFRGTPAPGAAELEPVNENQEPEQRATPAAPAQLPGLGDRDGFDQFWSAYPRKIAKGAARKAWPKAIAAAGSAAVVIAGAERYRDDPNRADQFTAYPATWLNGERWNDEPLPSRGPQRATVANEQRFMPREGDEPTVTEWK